MSQNAALAFAPLLTPEGWALLESLPPYDGGDPLKEAEKLRKAGHSPELVAAALTQQRLRAQAQRKFGPFAARMLFTPDGLEQATRLSVSAHHAARYATAGVSRVADLGCGIGGDALALAGMDLAVLAVERDEATAALATINLMPFERAEVRCADALEIDLAAEGVDAIFADPARRAGGKRIMDPEGWSPRLSEVLAWREQVAAVGVKVAPGLDHAAIPGDAHAQWVSVGRSVVEAGLWFGPLAPEGPGRSALVIDDAGAAHTLSTAGDPSESPEQVAALKHPEELGEYIIEPDGAVIRAGLVARVAEELGAQPIAPRIAYLTTDTPSSDTPTIPSQLRPFVRRWRVREVLPLHLKDLKAYAKRKELGRLEIHCRGVDVSPDALRASLRLRGSNAQTWLVTRLGSGTEGRSPRGAVLVVEAA